MTIIEPVFTYEHLAEMPDDSKRYEILEGELVVSPAPVPRHQEITLNLATVLKRAEQAGYGKVYIAPLDIVFDAHDVSEPDVFFIRRERLHIVGPTNVQGAPDSIVEVLSPSTRRRDLGVKLRLYARFGVPYYWVADPDSETLQPYTLTAGGYVPEPVLRAGQTLTCPLFPDIPLDVTEIFA